MGTSYILEIAFQATGPSIAYFFILGSPLQSAYPVIMLVEAEEAPGRKEHHFAREIVDYSFTTEESTGLLTTLTATAEDGRQISVVVTPAGIDVDLRDSTLFVAAVTAAF